ncbi:MAG: nucleotidyltransferase family protein [Oscillospiraceae bacterium]|nr:nucleotidyltransferase family protein [Oscillospiraceae bacterium]
MRTVGIICEYNPFHNGHRCQLRLARALAGEDCALVCLMSGNFVQRGEPAVFPKMVRAEAALRCGADLVLELPLTAALSSAEGFATGGVSLLTALGCEALCYGIESDDNNIIMSTAKANLDPAFDALLRAELDTGCSYPAARQRALEALGAGEGLSSPNDILAVEYCKAILRQQSPLRLLPIHRPDTYHADTLDPEAPSATAIRNSICRDEHRSSADTGHDFADKQCLSLQALSNEPSPDWHTAVPSELIDLYKSAPVHTLEAGERAVLAVLRTLPDAAFQVLPFGSEGLWSKFMKNCRSCAAVEEILDATKSKRYTRSRLQRMLLCAFLSLTAADLERQAPYVRVLGFTDRGRAALRDMRARFALLNAGERPTAALDPEDYYALETRASDLYGLFAVSGPEAPGAESDLRVRRC